MKKYFSIMVFVVSVAALLAGCGGGGGGSAPSSSVNVLAAGGVGSTGFGGDGGTFYIETAGTVTVRGSGSVDAGFASLALVSEPAPSFGPGKHLIVMSGETTTVLLDTNSVAGKPCMISSPPGDGTIYFATTTGICSASTDSVVTGVTVEDGATLVLVDATVVTPNYLGYGTLIVSHDVVVNGTIISHPTNTNGLEIDSLRLFIGNNGKLSASATVLNTPARDINLGSSGNTIAIYNHGTIEAKGLGSGDGGYIGMSANDLVVNYGTLDTSGGSSTSGIGGNGTFSPGINSIEIFVYYGNFYSSGTVRMNGGRGGTGGDAGSALIETASIDNSNGQNGDIFISGTWEAMGGEGVTGSGGGYGFLGFLTDAMGKVAVNATLTLSGGKGSGTLSSGGAGGGIGFSSQNLGSIDVATPGSIRISGTFDVRGGDGNVDGGAGGSLDVIAPGANPAFKGCDVELLGFPALSLNGGNGADGGSGNADAFEIYTYAPQYPAVSAPTGTTNTTKPAGAIFNEANVSAKGGAAAGTTGAGGTGGYAEMIANVDFGFPLVQDATTVVKNSGSFDVSGGNGYTGGGTVIGSLSGYSLYFEAFRVTSSGKLVAKGGNGTTTGGNGGDIAILSTGGASYPSVASKTDMYVSGGTGASPGGSGTRLIDGI